MSSVLRPLLIGFAALAVAAGASADNGVSVKGTLVSVTTQSVAAKDARGVVLTCRVADRSPSLTGYNLGDRVQMVCVRVRHSLVLAKLRHASTPAGETLPVTFAGAITTLSATSISLHDGDRDLTCAIGDSSPSTDGFKVGQHARVACAGGTLLKISAIEPEPTHTTVGAQGTLAAVSTSSISVQTDGGTVTCAVGERSPGLGDYHVGDHVKMACVDGTLTVIAKVDTAPPPPPPPAPAPTGSTISGTITALSASSITVHNDEHELTCALGPSSPALGDYKLGDAVGMGCVDGTLVKIAKRI